MYVAVCKINDRPTSYLFSTFHEESIGAEGDVARQLYASGYDPAIAFDPKRTTVYGAENKTALRALIMLEVLR